MEADLPSGLYILQNTTLPLEWSLAKFRNRLSDRTFIVAGIVFLVTGVGLWVYTEINIRMLEQRLNNANLSVEERWSVEGSLRWWRDFSMGLNPTAAVLIAGGVTVLLFTYLRARSRVDKNPRRKPRAP